MQQTGIRGRRVQGRVPAEARASAAATSSDGHRTQAPARRVTCRGLGSGRRATGWVRVAATMAAAGA